MVTNPNIAPDPSPGRFNSALPLQGHSPGRRRRRRDRGRPENIQTTETGRGVTRKSSGVVTAGKDRHNASIAGQGSYSVCRTRTGCARNPRRFDSGGTHQFSVDTRILRRTVGWVLGSPETKPLKRYVVIAVCRLTKRPSKRDLLTARKDGHHGRMLHINGAADRRKRPWTFLLWVRLLLRLSCADAFCGGPFPGFERVKKLPC